jgi:hypothetical protein
MDASGANAVNGGISTHKSSDKSMSWQDLKDAVDAAKVIVTVIMLIFKFLWILFGNPIFSVFIF